MKKTLLSLASLLAFAALPFCAYAEDEAPARTWAERCDVNGDGAVTVADISTIVEYLLGNITDEPVTPPAGDENLNGYEAVDLGLSVKWSACNLGAAIPADYGTYIQWAEYLPEGDNDNDPNNGPYNDHSSITAGKSFETLRNEGIIDENGVLTLEYDAAHIVRGGDWRLPTDAEFEELITNCSAEYDVVRTNSEGEDVKGTLFTGPNGNSIFIPYSGRILWQTLSLLNTAAMLWTTNGVDNNNQCKVARLWDNSQYSQVINENRYLGLCARPVVTKK